MAEQLRVCDLSHALARMGANAQLLRQVAGFFQSDAPQILLRLRTAMAQADARGVQLAAHSIKGLVVNFDAEAAALAAIRVEELARSGDLSSGPEAVDELERQLTRLSDALDQELREL